MPVDINFRADDNLITATWTNPVSHADFAEAFKVAKTVYATATTTIHTIYEASHLTALPGNAISIYLRDPNSPLKHRMAGYFVVVASNAFIRSIVETAGRVARNPRVVVTATIEEAHAIIAKAAVKQK
jgi:hypothetical protein